jgi:hypothetical protein
MAGDALRGRIDDVEGRLGVARGDDEQVRRVAVEHELVVAVEDEAVRRRAGPRVPHERERGERLPLLDAPEMVLLAGGTQQVGGQAHGREERQRRQRPPRLLHDGAQLHPARARERRPAELARERPRGLVPPALGLHRRADLRARAVGGEHAPRGALQLRLLGREGEVHGGASE